jgi:hypothetical protein
MPNVVSRSLYKNKFTNYSLVHLRDEEGKFRCVNSIRGVAALSVCPFIARRHMFFSCPFIKCCGNIRWNYGQIILALSMWKMCWGQLGRVGERHEGGYFLLYVDNEWENVYT